MQAVHFSTVRNFFAAAVFLCTSLGFATPVFANSAILNPDGTLTYLRTLGGPDSLAYGINDAGQVTGFAKTRDGSQHAFITDPNGVGMTDLGTLGGGASSAYGINDAGQVAGSSITKDGSTHAFITGPNGMGMTDRGTLGGPDSLAYDINDVGQVVGTSTTQDGSVHAFVTGPDGVGMTDLNSLLRVGLPAGGVLGDARDINNHGQVLVGVPSIVPEPETYAMLLVGLALVGFIARLCKTA